jgi:hypothetical protein
MTGLSTWPSKPAMHKPPHEDRPDAETLRLARWHLRFGWWWLLLFLSLGIGLEALHGFKIDWYLAYGTRREMWRLAHAHGTLLALVHLAFAATLPLAARVKGRWQSVASRCLTGAAIALPTGFFLGGLYLYSADPGLGIVLVPLGAVLLFVAVLLTARNVM